MPLSPPIRVLIAKPGLDGHDRGAKVVTKALIDAGMEVVYTGRHQTIGAIVRTAEDEDVEAIGVSLLSGAHVEYCTRMVEALHQARLEDVVLMAGGTISGSSVEVIRNLGFEVFPTGSALSDIISYVENAVAERRRPDPAQEEG